MTLEPFAARLLIASRGDMIEEILRLRGELAAAERDRERHDATVILWEQATADREQLRAELAAAQAERDEMRADSSTWEALVKAGDAVIEAACRWREALHDEDNDCVDEHTILVAAVDTWCAASKERGNGAID